MHTIIAPVWIWIVLLSAATVGALVWGGRTERLGAVIICGGWLATIGVSLVRRPWNETQWGLIGVDGIILLLLLVLALRSRRWWPLWAAGFQLLAVITHIARMVDRHMGAWAYFSAAVIWGYLLVISLGVGAYNRWRERRQLAAIGAAIAEPGATRL